MFNEIYWNLCSRWTPFLFPFPMTEVWTPRSFLIDSFVTPLERVSGSLRGWGWGQRAWGRAPVSLISSPQKIHTPCQHCHDPRSRLTRERLEDSCPQFQHLSYAPSYLFQCQQMWLCYSFLQAKMQPEWSVYLTRVCVYYFFYYLLFWTSHWKYQVCRRLIRMRRIHSSLKWHWLNDNPFDLFYHSWLLII